MDRTRLTTLLDTDPVPWLLASDEPMGVLVTLTEVLGRDPGSKSAAAARALVVADPTVHELVSGLPDWGSPDGFPGHDSPKFLPNMLDLLSDMGVGAGDFDRIEEILDEMLAHQDDDGRFQSFGRIRGASENAWVSLLCDTHAITDVMFRFGRGQDPRVELAATRMREDVTDTNQGLGWRCRPERRTLFRGPGRKADVCPIVTHQGLRAFSHLAAGERPPEALEIARTALEVWRRRVEERPYMFGHGYQFKSAKWPNLWYDVLYVLETVGRYPELWTGSDARDEDVRAIAELAACLIEYNFDADGRVTPRRAYRGFGDFSFGQKKEPSPFATARALASLVRVLDLSDLIRSIDVDGLPSSKGGTGVAVPPRSRRDRASEPACHDVVPQLRRVGLEVSVRRVIERHHLLHGARATSAQSVAADIVGLRVRSGVAPYLSLLARIPKFSRDRLDDALYTRRSLARFRAMRGHVFIARPSSLQVLFCATSPEILRYSRHNLEVRGVEPAAYEKLADRILSMTAEQPLSTKQLRERLDTHDDVGAVVTLMCDEGLLLRDRPAGSWRDLRMTYVPLAKVLPEVRLGGLTRVEASAELVRAYVRGFGPVTHKDIVWWTGVGAKRVDPALELLGDEIVRVTVEGLDDEYLMHAADLDELELVTGGPRHSVALVPALDPYPMGYAIRDRYVEDEHRPFIMDRAANTAPLILIDGLAAGVWDMVQEPEPTVLLHLFSEIEDDLRTGIVERAEEVGRLSFGSEVDVRTVPEMRPLPRRGVGAFMRPLRESVS